jgi:hypothetical protein
MGLSSGSGNSASPRETHAPAIDLPAESTPPRTILDDILTKSIPAPPPNELAALKEALRGVRGQEFSLSPVAEEMVAAILQRSQSSRAVGDPALRAMAIQIARTLFDDPAARRRLAGLWARLSEK